MSSPSDQQSPELNVAGSTFVICKPVGSRWLTPRQLGYRFLTWWREFRCKISGRHSALDGSFYRYDAPERVTLMCRRCEGDVRRVPWEIFPRKEELSANLARHQAIMDEWRASHGMVL